MGFAIGIIGVVALVVAALIAVLVSAGGGTRAQVTVATVGLLCVAAFVTWGVTASDGQPWSVNMSRYGGGNTEEVGNGPTGALLGRTVLRALGTGLLLGSLLVFFVNRSKRRRGGTRRHDDSSG